VYHIKCANIWKILNYIYQVDCSGIKLPIRQLHNWNVDFEINDSQHMFLPQLLVHISMILDRTPARPLITVSAPRERSHLTVLFKNFFQNKGQIDGTSEEERYINGEDPTWDVWVVNFRDSSSCYCTVYRETERHNKLPFFVYSQWRFSLYSCSLPEESLKPSSDKTFPIEITEDL